mmetsp:Transcript_23435/g.34589  ORF Transcript_23435/g.34589 Transcript_23435/m.34589 type:complete len:107 (-) Transcript_23435:295-615(-)
MIADKKYKIVLVIAMIDPLLKIQLCSVPSKFSQFLVLQTLLENTNRERPEKIVVNKSGMHKSFFLLLVRNSQHHRMLEMIPKIGVIIAKTRAASKVPSMLVEAASE